MQIKEFKITTESACILLANGLLLAVTLYSIQYLSLILHCHILPLRPRSICQPHFSCITLHNIKHKMCNMYQQCRGAFCASATAPPHQPYKTNTSPHFVLQTQTHHQSLLHTRHLELIASAFATCTTAVSLA